jgi:hypothetical protein
MREAFSSLSHALLVGHCSLFAHLLAMRATLHGLGLRATSIWGGVAMDLGGESGPGSGPSPLKIVRSRRVIEGRSVRTIREKLHYTHDRGQELLA